MYAHMGIYEGIGRRLQAHSVHSPRRIQCVLGSPSSAPILRLNPPDLTRCWWLPGDLLGGHLRNSYSNE